ncbi:uncharacterized protein DFL_004174 [Arthrobotrys flagrans]|uniref:Uncharacterized protein n=1 Tax=Arthrobotrys flagrans TaxID=97331 RepID=A0A437A452_ARTFL|nr:hypothetical protein DFL_004174 [Arthrobotrys flagrans]
MFRFFYGTLPRRIELHRTFPVLVAAFVLPSDRRRERSPVFFSSLKSLAGFSSLFLPQVPIPDTSKIKDKLLGTLPSWTVESAVSKFVKRPDADIIVGISMQMSSLTAFVMYYPKGVEILADSRINSAAGVEEYKVLMPTLKMVSDWDMAQDGKRRNGTLPIMKYSSEFPHLPIGPGLYVNGTYKLWDPERHDFRIHFTDFFPTEDSPFHKLKPPAFNLTKRQIMTDYARAIRQHIEAFISREIVDDAMIVNDAPIIKWMVLYPDCMDSIETAPGVTVKRNFVSALKDAGFPLDDSDIPPVRPENLHAGREDRFNESVLEDLPTGSSMVEFFSAGFASLINLSSHLGRQPKIVGLPQERPFIALIDDEEYLTARRCVFTSDSRFGVIQQQVCSVSRSPMFKTFPENMLDVVANILHEMDVFETLDEESIQLISKFSIKHWPESENWDDVMDILNRKMDKTSLLLKATGATSWGLEEGLDIPRMTPISAFEFAKVVRNELYAPTISTFGDIHGASPEIKDAVLVDTGRGETEAYSAILCGIYTLKDEFRDVDYPMPDDIFIIGPDLAKLLDMGLEAGTVEQDDVDEDDEDFMRDVSKTYSHLDHAKYDNMRVTIAHPVVHQPFQVFGLADAAGIELSRIFLDAHRK